MCWYTLCVQRIAALHLSKSGNPGWRVRDGDWFGSALTPSLRTRRADTQAWEKIGSIDQSTAASGYQP